MKTYTNETKVSFYESENTVRIKSVVNERKFQQL
jgi:hypothetical protein